MAKERIKIDLDTFKEMIAGKEVDISYHLCIYHGSIEVEVEDDGFNIDFKITSKSKYSGKIYECSVSVWKL